MELLGFEVEAQTPDADDAASEAGRWFADLFGVIPRIAAIVGDLDAASTRLTGPAGLTVDLVRPAPAGEVEATITEFIESAADLDGGPTEELAAAVLGIVVDAWRQIDERLAGVANNKVLATHLLLSQQSRAHPPDASPTYWQHSAASTLLGSFLGRS